MGETLGDSVEFVHMISAAHQVETDIDGKTLGLGLVKA
jgi:hypothetical protein